MNNLFSFTIFIISWQFFFSIYKYVLHYSLIFREFIVLIYNFMFKKKYIPFPKKPLNFHEAEI